MKGRPIKTEIREKIAVILNEIGMGYGYQIYKIYRKKFGYISLRNLYYNLKKGVELNEFIVIDIKKEKGYFTWGDEAEHKYYTLGPYSLFQKKLKLPQINWEEKVKEQISKLLNEIKNFKKLKLKYEEKRKIENKLKNKIELLKLWSNERVGKKFEDEIKKLYDSL